MGKVFKGISLLENLLPDHSITLTGVIQPFSHCLFATPRTTESSESDGIENKYGVFTVQSPARRLYPQIHIIYTYIRNADAWILRLRLHHTSCN